MPVDHPQREPAAGNPDSSQRSRKKAAVAAEHEGTLTTAQRGCHRVAQRRGSSGDLICRDDARGAITIAIAQWRYDIAGIAQAQALTEAGRAQLLRGVLLAEPLTRRVQRRSQQRPLRIHRSENPLAHLRRFVAAQGFHLRAKLR
jgi:hypothetical protein